jgi:hypothetical protein
MMWSVAIPIRFKEGAWATGETIRSPESSKLMNPQASFPQNGRLMQRCELRSKVLAKLTNARCELEDALNLSIPVARYDPVVIPEPTHNRLSAMIEELKGVVRQIEGSQ